MQACDILDLKFCMKIAFLLLIVPPLLEEKRTFRLYWLFRQKYVSEYIFNSFHFRAISEPQSLNGMKFWWNFTLDMQ